MSTLAIESTALTKGYRIGLKQSRRDTLAGAFAAFVRAPLTNLRELRRLTDVRADEKNAEDVVWAVRDLSFEVRQGEVLGIVGSNGAGKSTLLKLLSGITEPTAGRAVVRGRVASLLEVGTGFHPELTGRENVYLNGTILGMSQREIDSSFDEIVAFAEVERFIDTPIKRYSSGMAVRLAFAVGAHLQAEVLLVDEVLAVGDAAFQDKCLGRMETLASTGRTVLFVSHNMSSISNLCQRALWLQDGAIAFDGDAAEAVRRYLDSVRVIEERDLRNASRRSGFEGHLLESVRITSNGVPSAVVGTGDPLTLEVRVGGATDDLPRLSLGIQIVDNLGQRVLDSRSEQYAVTIRPAAGPQTVCATIDELMLTPGHYSVTLFLGTTYRDWEVIPSAISFEVVWRNREGIKTAPLAHWGPLFLPVRWQVERASGLAPGEPAS